MQQLWKKVRKQGGLCTGITQNIVALLQNYTASGMGLIKCGSVVIPFDNQISKDTDLYKLYNTKRSRCRKLKSRIRKNKLIVLLWFL